MHEEHLPCEFLLLPRWERAMTGARPGVLPIVKQLMSSWPTGQCCPGSLNKRGHSGPPSDPRNPPPFTKERGRTCPPFPLLKEKLRKRPCDIEGRLHPPLLKNSFTFTRSMRIAQRMHTEPPLLDTHVPPNSSRAVSVLSGIQQGREKCPRGSCYPIWKRRPILLLWFHQEQHQGACLPDDWTSLYPFSSASCSFWMGHEVLKPRYLLLFRVSGYD